MLYISSNLRSLRSKRNLSQLAVSDAMKFGLDQYKKYEYGKNTPPAESLLVISRFYHISIDLLLTVDLEKVSIGDLVTLENNRIVLPITVDCNGNNLVEVVTQKAKAGYAAGGYTDFSFISELDHISLPWLDKNEKHRVFPLDGDSMPPHNDKSSIIGKYIDKLGDVVDGKTYIIITKNNEMVYKRLNRNGKNTFSLTSDNSFYNSYEINFSDIAEIWEYAGSLEREQFKPETNDINNLTMVIKKIERDMVEIKAKMA
ncbi:XRE family transcriptional regulator [Flavobacterium cupreum]|uniref:XRE family transcriptional regulator n=1 Tax=Flavobacterium cupreum TaxID=2133766 RepID=A0A434A3R7_9FLAO|nr:helix-turn-helix domain-containing protein [Flavobacterium cupreum]RUT68982.1 XRE family transcriptional regulator [Flavobacterium cupreum]